jgi:hypothetical protein
VRTIKGTIPLTIALLAAVLAGIVVDSQGSFADSHIPKPLWTAIENTMKKREIQVSTSVRILSPSARKSFSDAEMEFEYPDRVETSPRLVKYLGKHYGKAIYIGRNSLTLWPLAGFGARFMESTESGADGEASQEDGLVFYPLLCALKAMSFSKSDSVYTFVVNGNVHGSVAVHDGQVSTSFVIYRTKPAHGIPSLTIRKSANYHGGDNISPIVFPPKSDIHR